MCLLCVCVYIYISVCAECGWARFSAALPVLFYQILLSLFSSSFHSYSFSFLSFVFFLFSCLLFCPLLFFGLFYFSYFYFPPLSYVLNDFMLITPINIIIEISTPDPIKTKTAFPFVDLFINLFISFFVFLITYLYFRFFFSVPC